MIKKRYLLLINCFLITILAGCWDNVPIEDRGFVVGSAIDLKEGKVNGHYELSLTNQFVVPIGLSSPTNGSGTQKPFLNLSASGDSIFAIDEEMATLTSKMPFFEHLKLLVVSNELLKTPDLLANVLDVFVRDKEMRRSVKVVAASGEAKDMLDIDTENGKIPAVYINDLLEISLKKTSLFEPINVGKVHEKLLQNSSLTIPQVTLKKGKIDYKGGAVFHGFEDKLAGILNEEEMTGLNLIVGRTASGTITIKFEGHLMTYKIYNAKSSVHIDTKDPKNLNITVDIDVEGGITEVFGNKNLNDLKTLDKVEKDIAREIETIAGHTIERAQKDMNADIFSFDETLSQRHYDTWQKIKDNWDHGEDYFAKSNIQVIAKARIRTTGATEKMKGNWRE